MRVYLSGAMSGLDEEVYRAIFSEGKRKVLERFPDAEVIDPCNQPGGLRYDTYMLIDMLLIRECDAIAMLPGWELSLGANTEYRFAKNLGMPVYIVSAKGCLHVEDTA